jgi:hypothetical protein
MEILDAISQVFSGPHLLVSTLDFNSATGSSFGRILGSFDRTRSIMPSSLECFTSVRGRILHQGATGYAGENPQVPLTFRDVLSTNR